MEANQTKLVSEKARVNISGIIRDPDNPPWLRVMAVLPPDIGGWRMHEVGVFAKNGNLFAVGKLDGAYKPQMGGNLLKEIGLDVVFEVDESANVILALDPNVILATREWVTNYFDPKFSGLEAMVKGKVSKEFEIETRAPLTGGGPLDKSRLILEVKKAGENVIGVLPIADEATTAKGESAEHGVCPKWLLPLVKKFCNEVEAKIPDATVAAAKKLATARKISLKGMVKGSADFSGEEDVIINTIAGDDFTVFPIGMFAVFGYRREELPNHLIHSPGRQRQQ
ncbi:hypothetical protein C4J81_01055 [Deltaproteobacteria bacterium Smac51]|nr:hypothetical protein C4J81_01055 [Deltaproteobacteria bacterium Smac51]